MTQVPHGTDSFWVRPGRLLAGPYPGAPTRDEAATKLTAFLDAGVTRFIDLTEEGEGPPLHPYAPLLEEIARARGIDVAHRRLSIVDVSVPAVERMRTILAAIDDALSAGEPAYVHCWGGVGRTGTVIACLLIEQGRTPEAALEELADVRRATDRSRQGRVAPETDEQRAFVRRWRPQSDSRTSTQG
jgi:hypothetical protein